VDITTWAGNQGGGFGGGAPPPMETTNGDYNDL